MAQATFVQEGSSVDYTPAADVAGGQVVVRGALVGIANGAIAASALGSLAVGGVFDVVQAAVVFAAGDRVYWDADGDPVGGTAGTGAATNIAAGNTFMGFALAATLVTGATVRVRLASDQPMTVLPVQSVAATGSAQADAAALLAGMNVVTGADDTKGVKLPAAVAGTLVIVKSTVAAKALKVYPNTDDKINGGAANAALTMAAQTAAVLVALDGTDWFSIPLLPS